MTQRHDKDFVIAEVDRKQIKGRDGMIDITGADDVEIEITSDGRVIFINAPDCRMRICGIRGKIKITDKRPRRPGSRLRGA